jgi:hypothetical protein
MHLTRQKPWEETRDHADLFVFFDSTWSSLTPQRTASPDYYLNGTSWTLLTIFSKTMAEEAARQGLTYLKM